MVTKPMHGVYTILVTPFDQEMRVDTDSLEQLVEYNLDAGVHGLGVALGSEVVALSEAERSLVTRTIVEQVRGRVPVVINTGGPVAELALLYSRMAKEDGADALMLRPPTFQPAGPDQTMTYYKLVSDAVGLPIFIQDTPSTPVSGSLARQIGETCEHVRYVKVESPPPPYKVAQAVASAGDLMTVFGGAGGSFFIEEMRRGSSGTMPGCSQPEDFVAIWDTYQRGDEATALRILFERILPVNRLATQSPGAFYHVHKEILHRRGIIRTANVRGPVQPLDPATQQEIGPLLDALDAQTDTRRPT